jgi:hypothetical protein
MAIKLTKPNNNTKKAKLCKEWTVLRLAIREEPEVV